MDGKPKRTWRRWFQFSLTTWLVLVGIVAWVMATRPWVVTDIRYVVVKSDYEPVRAEIRLNRAKVTKWTDDRKHDFPYGTQFYSYSGGVGEFRGNYKRLNLQLGWAALVLVAFIGWKTYWLIHEQRKLQKQPTVD